MAADSVFLDTSLIVAASVTTHPGYAAARAYLVAQRDAQAPWLISPQICREFLVVLTRQPVAGRAFTPEEALQALDEWTRASNLLDEDQDTVDACLDMVKTLGVHGKQVHDCNIVAVMQVNGVARLATRNPDHFRRYTKITVDGIAP